MRISMKLINLRYIIQDVLTERILFKTLVKYLNYGQTLIIQYVSFDPQSCKNVFSYLFFSGGKNTTTLRSHRF